MLSGFERCRLSKFFIGFSCLKAGGFSLPQAHGAKALLPWLCFRFICPGSLFTRILSDSIFSLRGYSQRRADRPTCHLSHLQIAFPWRLEMKTRDSCLNGMSEVFFKERKTWESRIRNIPRTQESKAVPIGWRRCRPMLSFFLSSDYKGFCAVCAPVTFCLGVNHGLCVWKWSILWMFKMSHSYPSLLVFMLKNDPSSTDEVILRQYPSSVVCVQGCNLEWLWSFYNRIATSAQCEGGKGCTVAYWKLPERTWYAVSIFCALFEIYTPKSCSSLSLPILCSSMLSKNLFCRQAVPQRMIGNNFLTACLETCKARRSRSEWIVFSRSFDLPPFRS